MNYIDLHTTLVKEGINMATYLMHGLPDPLKVNVPSLSFCLYELARKEDIDSAIRNIIREFKFRITEYQRRGIITNMTTKYWEDQDFIGRFEAAFDFYPFATKN
jgi:hypothetical protein